MFYQKAQRHGEQKEDRVEHMSIRVFFFFRKMYRECGGGIVKKLPQRHIGHERKKR
jgi:hypothetical protein